jgi:hypothetical protein
MLSSEKLIDIIYQRCYNIVYIVNMQRAKMNAVQSHLEKLKKYTPPNILEGVNKIYFLEVIEKPDLVKIGDTHRLVETRNDETLINASLHRSKPVTWVVAEKWDGSSFRDKSFHKFLENKGYKRELNDKGSKSEWWHITLEKALEELESFIQKPIYKTVELRTAQHYVLEQLQEAHKEGYQYINAGLCVRVGKTIISLTDAATNKWMPVYVGKNLTSQSSAETDNAEYGIVPEMLTQSLHGVDELEDGDLSKRTKQIIENINKSNKANRSIIFFVDEVDDASHTKRSRDIITPIVEYFKKHDKFACIVTMSGTRIYRGEKILKELTDGSIKEISLEYYEMQILQPETTCRRNFRHISFYSEKPDGLVNISDAMKNKDQGHKSLATCIVKLLGTNNFEFVVNDKFPHWFMKFSTVGKNNANALVRYLNRNCSIVENKQYHFEPVNGDVTSAKEAQDYCKTIIKQNPNKSCVFISQGMATTSFSVVTIGNSVVFTDNEITADDSQALHRSATWDKGKDDCNMIVVTTNDSKEYTFDDIFEDETKIAKSRGEKIEIYKELLNNNSMIHFHEAHGFRPVVVTQDNADKVIDKKMQAMTKIASFMNILNDIDEEIEQRILDTVTGTKSTSKKSGSAKADTFDPFIISEKDESKNKNLSNANISTEQKEKILRAFVENVVNVPAIAREQGTTIEEFKFWEEIQVSKELFFEVYNSSWLFKDRIDAIYNLCDDRQYLVENYINKFAS